MTIEKLAEFLAQYCLNSNTAVGAAKAYQPMAAAILEFIVMSDRIANSKPRDDHLLVGLALHAEDEDDKDL